jgi:hypothetical protein
MTPQSPGARNATSHPLGWWRFYVLGGVDPEQEDQPDAECDRYQGYLLEVQVHQRSFGAGSITDCPISEPVSSVPVF